MVLPMTATLNPPVRPVMLRPTLRFMLQSPAHCVALGFGSGLPRVAPGTFGTLFGWVAFVLMQRWLPPAAMGWIVLAAWPVGWWACTVTARRMNLADPGSIVWDEIAAFWLILWIVMPAGWIGQAIAFGLFRFFDAVKPGPVAWADGLFKQRGATPSQVRWELAGFGILFDDLVAAFCTLMVIALWRVLA